MRFLNSQPKLGYVDIISKRQLSYNIIQGNQNISVTQAMAQVSIERSSLMSKCGYILLNSKKVYI